jgi:hypothetical protein
MMMTTMTDQDVGRMLLLSTVSTANGGIEHFMTTTSESIIWDESILIDMARTVSVTQLLPNEEPSPLPFVEKKRTTIEADDDDDNDDDEGAVPFVEHTPSFPHENKDTHYPMNDKVDQLSNTVVRARDIPKKIKLGNLHDGFGVYVLILIISIFTITQVQVYMGKAHNARLRQEIDLYQQELQTQNVQIMHLNKEVTRLEYTNVVNQERLQKVHDMWERRVHNLQKQRLVSQADKPTESMKQLQEWIHQLLEEATAMEVNFNKEIRRYQRGYRKLQREKERCHHIVSKQNQSLLDTSHLANQCSKQKQQLKQELNQVQKELKSIQKKLRTKKKESKGTSKEVKRQTKVILKLQKQLVDLEAKTAEAIRQRDRCKLERRRHDRKENPSSRRHYHRKTSTFNFTPKSINIDNCWIFADAKMDWGECWHDMTDQIKEHFHTIGHTVSQSFRNALQHIRQEMKHKQTHDRPSQQSSDIIIIIIMIRLWKKMNE